MNIWEELLVQIRDASNCLCIIVMKSYNLPRHAYNTSNALDLGVWGWGGREQGYKEVSKI